jgi:hypothetical protein
MYTGENDAMRLEHGDGLDLDPTVLTGMLSKLSINPSSADFINPSPPPAWCMPLCLDQATRSLPLKELPTLDDIDITSRQKSDQSCGMHIPRTDATNNRRSAGVASGPGKGKEKIVSSGSASKMGSWSASSDTETSTEEIAPLERKRRLVHSDGSAVSGLPLSGQQAPKKAATPQPVPKVAASMAPGGSGSDGSITAIKEATTATVAVAPKEAMEAAVPEEATAMKKVTEVAIEEVVSKTVTHEATMVKAAEKAMAKMAVEEAATATAAAEEATTKTTAEEATTARVAAEEATTKTTVVDAVAMVGPNGSGSGGLDAVQTNSRGAPDTTPDLKVMGKRHAAMTELGGSSPPPPASAFTTPVVCHAFIVDFFLFSSHSSPMFSDPCMHVAG